jgi:hypothetical protein
LSGVDPELLPDSTLVLQPGLRYQQTAWPVDDLLKLYLAETIPDELVLEPTDIGLEIRGARGVFHINRVRAGTLTFRASIQAGHSIGDAAERALDAGADLDPGRELAGLFDEGLVTAVSACRH